tara:strand:- start:2157 stop:3425 length:1269 start_codon:yes stop_codon:yes gene_type:complete
MADFEAYWDLKDFLELLNHGKDLGSKYFFLIRDFGIFFYVRDTDFKWHRGPIGSDLKFKPKDESTQMLKYAKGFLNRDSLSEIDKKGAEGEEWDTAYEKYQKEANKFSKHGICEWFNLTDALISEVNQKVKEGFIKIRLSCNTIDYSTETKKLKFQEIKNIDRFKNISWEDFQNLSQTFSISIKDGAKCDPTTFEPQLNFEYVNQNQNTVKINNYYDKKPFYIDEKMANLIISKTKEVDENNFRNLGNKAQNFEDKENFTEAIKYYGKMIDIFPRSYFAWFKRGLAKRQNKDNQGAVEDYTRSIGLNPDYKTYANRAVAYLALEDKESAYDDLEECLKLNPKDDIALGNRGRLKIEKGEYSESIIDFDKAIEIYPENAFNFHCRAFAKYKINDQQGAQEDWNIAADMGLEIASKALKDYFHE